MKKLGTRRLNDLPNITQLANSRAFIESGDELSHTKKKKNEQKLRLTKVTEFLKDSH